MIHECAREGCKHDSLSATGAGITVEGNPARWYCSLRCLRRAQGTGPGKRAAR